MTASSRIDWHVLTDDQLLAQCEWDRYRASGPGGQKRNKTDSAVRLRHQPTGLIVLSADSRSQHENRAKALRRLRAALAFELRQPLAETDPLPDYLVSSLSAGKLKLSARNPSFLPIAAWTLDLLDLSIGQVSSVAERLGISTGNLVRFLQTDPDCWQAANRLRAKHSLPALRSER